MAEIGLMRKAGCVYVTDADRPIVDSKVFRRVLAYAKAFDVLFAVNRVLHPGEKRLVSHAEATCALRPDGLRDLAVGVARAGPDVVARADALARTLEALAAEEGLA